MIDKAIIQNMSGAAPLQESIVQSFKVFLSNPVQFVKRPEVLMVWGVYGFTYLSANIINTTSKAYSFKPDMPRLVATTAANMGAGIAKDRAYARMFGTVAPRGLPATSYLFFFSRDLVTMGASFNIPEPLANEMHASLGIPQTTSDVAAQLFCPVAMQFVTTPMHLMGLDMYNRPHSSWRDRVDLISSNYRKTVAARIARILPAFGFGGLGNRKLRNDGHAYIRQRHHAQPRKEPVVVLGRDLHVDDGRGRLFPTLSKGLLGGAVVPIPLFLPTK